MSSDSAIMTATEAPLKVEEKVSSSKLPLLKFDSSRRFGIELEILAFDGRNRPLDGGNVAGIAEVTNCVGKLTERGADQRPYEHTINNSNWVVKPDSSCGLEVVSPPLSGWRGINEVAKVVEGLYKNPSIKVDNRCSVHVHIEHKDLSEEQLATSLAYWIKCEAVFMDSVPPQRKINRYCQFLGLTSKFDHNQYLSSKQLIQELGDVKYYSINTNQMVQSIKAGHNNRPTFEIRITEGAGCKDPYLVKNWIRLLIHFVEMTKNLEYPKKYTKDCDPKTNWLCWLDTNDVFDILGFTIDNPKYELSPGLRQTRNWFLARMAKNIVVDDAYTVVRTIAYEQIQRMIEKLKEQDKNFNLDKCLTPSDLTAEVFGPETNQ